MPDDAWVTNIDSVNVSPQSVASPTRRTRKLRWAGLGLTWALAAIGIAAVVAALDLRQTGDYRLETFSRTQEPAWSTSDNAAPRRSESQPAQPRTSSVAESPRPPEPRPDPVASAKAVSGQAKARAAGDRAGVRKDPPEISKAVQPENQRKRIEAEVQAALQNRAIDGVVVSVVDGTAYLDGRVASLRQKTMAERAARSVAEVKRVRNRLDVTTARIYRNSWRDASVTRE